MDMKIYSLPGSVVIIGLVYAMGLAFAPAPGQSAPTLAMPLSDERPGVLGAHPKPPPDLANCAHTSDAATENAALLQARYVQPYRGAGARDPVIRPAPPGKLTVF